MNLSWHGNGKRGQSKEKGRHETTQRENQGDQTGKGNTRTQTNTGNTREHHSIAPRASLAPLASRAALVHGGKGNKGPQKTPGHTNKAEEHKGAKATQDSKFPPTSCERPAAREQKAKGKHYQNTSPKPPQMVPKTSPNRPKNLLK